MVHYKNLGGRSGVRAYKADEDSITVQFADGAVYVYTYGSAGGRIIEKMKKLAQAGKGLSTYISRTVREKFEKKL